MKMLTFLLGAALCLATGCVIDSGPYYRVQTIPGGLTTDEVARMAKSGVSDQVIVDKINEEGLSAKPTSDQVASLKKDGVSDAVLGAMVAARVVPAETRVEYAYYPSTYYYYEYPYGYPYGAWGYYYPYGYGYGAYWRGHYGYYPHYGYPSSPAHGYSVSRYRR